MVLFRIWKKVTEITITNGKMRTYYNRPLLFLLGAASLYIIIKLMTREENERSLYHPPEIKFYPAEQKHEESKLPGNREESVHHHFENTFDFNVYSKDVIQNEWKAKIIQSVNGRWLEEKCQIRADFRRTMLQSPVMTPIFVYNSSKDPSISGSILRHGSWEEDLVKKIYSILSADLDLVFIDIGSNIGVYSLTAAKAGNRVIAVDCCRGNVMRLCASMRAGKLRDQMTIVHNAISDVRGKFEPKHITGDTKEIHQIEENIVDSILLDDLLQLGIDNRMDAVVRIDVDNYEAKVLKGAENFFKKVTIKYLLIDIKEHRKNEGGKFIWDFLKRHNMDVVHEGKYDRSNINAWPDTILLKKRQINSEF